MSKHRTTTRAIESFESTPKHSKLRRTVIATGSAAAAGTGLFLAHQSGVDYEDVRSTINLLIDGQFIPEPPVYPEAVDAMVAVNEAVRESAIPIILGAAGTYAVVKYKKSLVAEFEMSKHDYVGTDSFTENGETNGRFMKIKKGAAGLGLAATTVLLTGGSSGIEHEISNGPMRPIEQTFDLLSNNADGQRHMIVQSENNSFMDDTDVNKNDLTAFSAQAAEMGINVVPFNKTLQNIDDRSGLIITVPDALFAKATGETVDERCATLPIMLDEANTKKVGETVDINGVSAQVVEKLSGAAQMNRDVAVIAETDSNCIQKHDSETTFGAIVSGGKPGAAETLFEKSTLDDEAAMIPEEEFKENNRDFWRKNGTPLLLQLMGYIGALSYIGMSNERRNSLQRNVQAIATLHSQGVSFKTMKRIESIRAMRDSAKAMLISAPLMPLVAGAFNAAEVGLKVGVGVKELAVGGSIALAAKLFGGRRAVNQFKKKLNVESALKG